MKKVFCLVLCLTLALSLTAAPGMAEGQITLYMVESLTSPARSAVLQEIIASFEAEHPEIHIELVSPPLETADEKILQMLANGTDIDIFEVRDLNVGMLTANEYVIPLDDYVANWADAATLSETCTTAATIVGDHYYLIPYGFYRKMVYYRSDWFEDAGIAAPTTWRELIDASIKLTDPANGHYGFTFRGGSGGSGYYNMLLMDNLGEDMLDNSRNIMLADGSATIYSTDIAVETLKQYKELYEKGSPKDSITWGYPDQVQAFTSGVTAILIQDPEVVASCTASMEEGTWSTCAMIVGDSGKNAFFPGYAGWGITANCQYPDEAWEFIAYLSNPANNAKFAETYSTIPIHVNSGDYSDFFSKGAFAAYAYADNHPELYFFSQGMINYPENTQFNTMADQTIQAYLLGDYTEEECLGILNDFWKGIAY
ncbi:MAG: ABC transporter substrate-binding protein [Christensenellales bacterium]|jgi:multiple sugar transport system substrate-binding protein